MDLKPSMPDPQHPFKSRLRESIKFAPMLADVAQDVSFNHIFSRRHPDVAATGQMCWKPVLLDDHAAKLFALTLLSLCRRCGSRDGLEFARTWAQTLSISLATLKSAMGERYCTTAGTAAITRACRTCRRQCRLRRSSESPGMHGSTCDRGVHVHICACVERPCMQE